jgi:hypothetical protein
MRIADVMLVPRLNAPPVLFRRLALYNTHPAMASIRSFRTTKTVETIAPETTHEWLYTDERMVAISAVRRACIVTQRVFDSMADTDHFTKTDESPVTGSLFCFFCLS